MRRYLIVVEPYSRTGPEPLRFEFDSSTSLENLIHRRFWETVKPFKQMSFPDLLKKLRESNGDGCDHVQIIDLKREEVVFP